MYSRSEYCTREILQDLLAHRVYNTVAEGALFAYVIRTALLSMHGMHKIKSINALNTTKAPHLLDARIS